MTIAIHGTLKKVLMSFSFLDELFSKRIKRDFYFIPCAEHEIFLLLMRMVLECKTVKKESTKKEFQNYYLLRIVKI